MATTNDGDTGQACAEKDRYHVCKCEECGRRMAADPQFTSWTGVKAGDAVRIRPCAPEHGDKTYFGIYVGDWPHVGMGGAPNPAIVVPKLGKVIFGCESWWGKITEDQADKVITDEMIRNIWYVKLMREIHAGDVSDNASEAACVTSSTAGSANEAVAEREREATCE